MGLYERLAREQSPRISVHGFQAVLGLWERGRITTQQATDALGLSAGEATEAATLLAKIVPPRECVSLGALVTLTNVGATYDAITASQGLGVALIQTAGITQVIFGVKVQKVGTGTQSWQLWNETDGTEVAVIDDAGAATTKTLSTTVNFDPALGAGMKTIRVRAKSTVAADDPVYFGGTISIRRLSVLTAVELHEILLYAEHVGLSSTSLKSMLGIA